MNTRTFQQRITRPDVIWRILLLAGLGLGAFLALQVAEATILPEISARLGVAQLQPGDEAVQRLRLFETFRRCLPIVAVAAVVKFGLMLFVPIPPKWRRWLQDPLG